MIGFNGGLIGKTRVYASTGASSGVWTLDEIIPIKRGVVATGGAVTEFTDPSTGVKYKVHTFTSSSSFIVTQEGSVDYLVVGGGGGGGKSGRGGGGGGGGGYLTSNTTVTPQTYTITVGAGGAASTATTTNCRKGRKN